MATFLDLTNQLLRRLNEVEIASADFDAARGVQALAKDAIRNSIAKINQAEFTWPFNAAEHTATLAQGQEEYSWPTYFKVADWDSFQIQADSSLGVDYQHLEFIGRDYWYKRFRDADYNAGASGIDVPRYVFPAHGNGFGVSPSPDKAYSIRFRYYIANVDLVTSTDIVLIPEAYNHVIVEGALYFMYMFRDNIEQANVAAQVFQQGLKEMQSILINKYTRMTDLRVRY